MFLLACETNDIVLALSLDPEPSVILEGLKICCRLNHITIVSYFSDLVDQECLELAINNQHLDLVKILMGKFKVPFSLICDTTPEIFSLLIPFQIDEIQDNITKITNTELIRVLLEYYPNLDFYPLFMKSIIDKNYMIYHLLINQIPTKDETLIEIINNPQYLHLYLSRHNIINIIPGLMKTITNPDSLYLLMTDHRFDHYFKDLFNFNHKLILIKLLQQHRYISLSQDQNKLLKKCIYSKNLEMIVYLLSQVDINLGKPVDKACKIGSLEIFKLFEGYPNLEVTNKTLKKACFSGNLELVDYLLSSLHFDLTPNIKCLEWACFSGNRAIISRLGMSTNLFNQECLKMACYSGNPDLVSEIINMVEYPDLNELLVISIDTDSSKIFEVLRPSSELERRFIPNFISQSRLNFLKVCKYITPQDLELACSLGLSEVVELLVTKTNPTEQAMIECIKTHKPSPWVGPEMEKYVSILKTLLLDASLDPSFKQNQAFGLAVELLRNDMVEILSTDPRVNPWDRNGELLIYSMPESYDHPKEISLFRKMIETLKNSQKNLEPEIEIELEKELILKDEENIISIDPELNRSDLKETLLEALKHVKYTFGKNQCLDKVKQSLEDFFEME